MPGLQHMNMAEVYRDDENDEVAQQERQIRLQQLAQSEIEVGWQPPVVRFHDILNALANAKNCKQPGSDGVVAENGACSQLDNSFMALFAFSNSFEWMGN